MYKKIIIAIAAIFMSTLSMDAHTPKNRDFGFGLMAGEPSGLTFMFAVEPETNVHAYIGRGGYLNYKIGADYLWYFDAFNSDIVNLYAGPGAFFGGGDGFGNRFDRDDNLVIGARGVLGANIIPRNWAVEFFVEGNIDFTLAPTGLTHPFGSIGFRYYP